MLSLDSQLLAVFALVALAGVYVARRTLKEWSGKGKVGCGGGCGCAATKTVTAKRDRSLIPLEQVARDKS